MAKKTLQEFCECVGNNTLQLSYSSAKNLLDFKNPFGLFCDSFTKDFEQTDAMAFGSALHCFILENSRFLDAICVLPANIRGDKKDAFIAQFGTSENGKAKTQISTSEYEKIQAIAADLQQSELFNEYIANQPQNQKEQRIEQQILGIPFCGIVDCFGIDSIGNGFVLDIKTTGALANFKYSIEDWHYDLQAAIYLNFCQIERYIFLAIDKTTLQFQFFEISKKRIENGFEKLKKIVAKYNELRICIDSLDFAAKPKEYITIID